jgi:hypothetical protein
MTTDPRVQARKEQLLAETNVLLDAIAALAPTSSDPFTDADALATAVEVGLLDAPHLRGNAAGCGKIVTRIMNGACVAVDPTTGRPLTEEERIAAILAKRDALCLS